MLKVENELVKSKQNILPPIEIYKVNLFLAKCQVTYWTNGLLVKVTKTS